MGDNGRSINRRAIDRRSVDRRSIDRTYLESMTTTDLIKMADFSGLDIPYDLDRIFIIEELLDLYAYDRNEPDLFSHERNEPDISTEKEMEDTVLEDSVDLPKQYNVTFIDVIIRDPFWAFVFWEINAHDKELYENSPGFEGYFLRVIPVDTVLLLSKPRAEAIFTVQVGSEDNARYLGLSPAISETSAPKGAEAPAGTGRRNRGMFTVELCAGFKEEETVLAVSNRVRLPALPEISIEASQTCNNPLIRLSGYDDFHILRNNERTLRTKKAPFQDNHEQ